MREQRFDAVVVGAGVAGASAAYQLARRGRRVALVDARSFRDSGARWVNGVAPWMFDAADIARPEPPELRAADGRTAMFDLHWRRVQTVTPSPLWSCDMRLLVARLHHLANREGVVGFERTALLDLECENGRPVAAVLQPAGAATTTRLRAALFVDAAGVRGVLRDRVETLAAACPPLRGDDLCVAAQRVHRIRDIAAARAFLAERGADERDVPTLAGLDGGFSTLVLGFDLEAAEVEILVGNLGDGQHRSPLKIIDDAIGRPPWLGEVLFGGGGVIPLRRPFDRFVAPGIALIGNAACQVFPAHGSGIGAGMIAARQLAEAVVAHDDIGSHQAVWAYQATFMRSLGAVHAAYDVFRRMTQKLTTDEAQELLRSGLLVDSGTRAALAHELPELSLRDLAQISAAALRQPRLAARFAPAVARLRLVHAHYRRYPQRHAAAAFERWARRAAWLVGSRPDSVPGGASLASQPDRHVPAATRI